MTDVAVHAWGRHDIRASFHGSESDGCPWRHRLLDVRTYVGARSAVDLGSPTPFFVRVQVYGRKSPFRGGSPSSDDAPSSGAVRGALLSARSCPLKAARTARPDEYSNDCNRRVRGLCRPHGPPRPRGPSSRGRASPKRRFSARNRNANGTRTQSAVVLDARIGSAEGIGGRPHVVGDPRVQCRVPSRGL